MRKVDGSSAESRRFATTGLVGGMRWSHVSTIGRVRMVQFNVGGWVALLAPGAGAGMLVAYVIGRRRVVGALTGAAVPRTPRRFTPG